MEAKQLLQKDLKEFVEHLLSSEYRVIAPVSDGELFLFAELKSFDEMNLEAIITDRPPKEHFFPRTEKILSYDLEKDGVHVKSTESEFPKTVLLGTRPCDAASLTIMDKVFNSEYQDDLYQARREATTVISIACTGFDDACFCTSAGFSPQSKEGSDILLSKDDKGDYFVQILTEKGESLLTASSGKFFSDVKSGSKAPEEIDGPPKHFDLEKIKPWLDEHFEHQIWDTRSLKCLGCGSCSFLCPTCHCFDITDETGMQQGDRIKNWDCCGFGLFTLHASGHNPRTGQSSRYRQRIMHKFKYYVDNFDQTACVGCGRCLRACPVDMNMMEMLSQISETETAL